MKRVDDPALSPHSAHDRAGRAFVGVLPPIRAFDPPASHTAGVACLCILLNAL